MNWKQPKVFAVQHKNEKIRAASRSGGIFTAISDYVLEQDGVIYGCILSNDFTAVHVRAESKDGRNLMCGSKYIQSKMADTYKCVKEDLLAGRKTLFSGTSCQVAGLEQYLGKEYENLFCVDIVCHGVPSPKVWKTYLQWQEKRNKSKVKTVNFRNKKDYGWRAHKETLTFENEQIISSGVFTALFYGHCILRPCCYECPYKSVMHPGDITIGDYWGIEKAAPEYDDNKGVSLVLVNNAIGEKVFDSIKKNIKWKETRLEDSMQMPLQAPFQKPENRHIFWHDFSKGDFNYVAKKYGGAGVANKLIRGLRKIKRKLVK